VSTQGGKGNQAIREYIEAVRTLELEEQVKEDILGGTAARLLKLGNPALSNDRTGIIG
jgi:hypothetical protein